MREHSTPSSLKLNQIFIQPTVRPSSLGAQVSSSRSLEVITLFIHTLNSAHIPISVLIVEQLATPIHNSVYTHLNKVPYLKGLMLAHPVTGDDNFEISILIGADYYWDFVQDGIVRVMGQQQLNHNLACYCLVHFPCPNLWPYCHVPLKPVFWSVGSVSMSTTTERRLSTSSI